MSWTLDDYETRKRELRDAYRDEYPLGEVDEKMSYKRLVKDKEKALLESVRTLSDTKASADSQLSLFIHCVFIVLVSI